MTPCLTFVASLPLRGLAHRRSTAAQRVRRRWVAKPIARCVPANADAPTNPAATTTTQPAAPRRARYAKHLPLFLTLLTVPLLPLLRAPLAYLSAVSATLPKLEASLLIALTNFFTVLFCFPANMALMIAAGAILGPLPAFIALFSSKMLASIAAFQLTTRLFKQRVEKMLGNRPRLSKLLNTGSGWRFVLLMRLSPFPGFMLNYLLAITRIPFWEYFIGTFVGTLPSVLNLVLVGDAARDVGMGIGGLSVRGGWLQFAIRWTCTLSMVLVTVLVTKKVKQVFREYDDYAEIVEA